MNYKTVTGKISRSKKSLVLASVQFLLPVIAFAQGTNNTNTNANTGADTISREAPVVNLDQVLQRVRDLFFGFVIVACVFMILWAGFNYATSGGDEKKTEAAKKTITYAVVGLIVAALANTIVSIVSGVAMNQ